MVSMQKGGTESSNCAEIKAADLREEEINLYDYVRILWKRKYFIICVTILPAAALAVTLWISPREYTVSYIYDAGNIGINDKNFQMFQSRFFSEGNRYGLKKSIIDSGAISKEKGARINLQKMVEFQFRPAAGAKDSVLDLTITCTSIADSAKVARAVCQNVEKVMLVQLCYDQILTDAAAASEKLANIENSRFDGDMAAKTNDLVIAGLKGISPAAGATEEQGQLVRFDNSSQIQYLPISVQIQAAMAKKVELQAKAEETKTVYTHNQLMLDIDRRLISEMNRKDITGLSTADLVSLVSGLAGKYEQADARDHLSAIAKNLENIMLVSVPVVENPAVNPLGKGSFKKCGITLSISAIVAVLCALILDSLGPMRKNPC